MGEEGGKIDRIPEATKRICLTLNDSRRRHQSQERRESKNKNDEKPRVDLDINRSLMRERAKKKSE